MPNIILAGPVLYIGRIVMQTELLSLILEEAKRVQDTPDDDLVRLQSIYAAMLRVGWSSDLLKGKSYDQKEYEELVKTIDEDPSSEEDDVLLNQGEPVTDLEKQRIREFRIWLSMSRRSASDAFRYVKRTIHTDVVKGVLKVTSDSRREKSEAVCPKKAETSNNSASSVDGLVERTVKLRDSLLEKIVGQDNIIKRFSDGYFEGELSALMEKNRSKPKAIFLFAGSPGVGKTYLATEAAQAMEMPVKRFDMSGYADDNSAFELTGADANYKAPRPGSLTGFVHDHPASVLIFDEIEKSHSKVINLFLQILDAGVLYDSKYEQNISFKDTIIIFTTNAGKQLYQDTTKRNFSDVSRKVILDALEKDVNPATGKPFFPQAICSRFATGNVLLFNHLSANDLSIIAAQKLLDQQKNLKETFSIASSNVESLATTILFSLGGHCDARNVTGAAKRFFSSELFELYRLARADGGGISDIKIKSVQWVLDIGHAEKCIQELYEVTEDSTFLIFGSEEGRVMADKWQGKGQLLYAADIDEARQILSENEVSFSVIDYLHGQHSEEAYLNAEDIDSAGRELFYELRQNEPEMPVFIWETDFYIYNREEIISFLNKGADAVLHMTSDRMDECQSIIEKLQVQLWQQKAMDTLALKHQVLSYETAQSLSEDGTVGTIRVFDLRMTTAVDADEKNAILSANEKPDLHWEDIVISEDAKSELQYFQKYLEDSDSFLKKGAKAPKGLLLYGPPGTGKTSLAKVMASESDVTFLTASADQFISRWAGEGPQSVHRIFSIARKYAPAVLFIDEIDAIGRRRTESDTGDGRQEILNALLTEMDGFKSSVKRPVLVMAATNMGGNNGNTGALDPALVRRFDRSICIDLPDRKGRIKLLHILCHKNKMLRISEEMIQNLAERSIGMSPALMEGAVNTAIREAIRNNTEVTDEVVDEAFEKYNNGEEKPWNPSELLKTARHEAGHAFVCNYFGEAPSYLTIAARDNHGGYMMHSGAENKGSFTKKELLQRIAVALGGRAAEIVYYGEEEGISTGASSDLETATSIAGRMICSFGMYSEIASGTVQRSEISDETAAAIDKMVNKIIQEQLEQAVDIVRTHSKAMDRLVSTLMEKTHLNRDEIQKVLNN